ncbi:hypothetical protein I552_2499 [Mycobacterium xenopi 3993]|nr:hypothetical protein I552_2499 [Mycobacterium xenopi 3993]
MPDNSTQFTAADRQLGQKGVGGIRNSPHSAHCGAVKRRRWAASQNGSVVLFTAMRTRSPGIVVARVAVVVVFMPHVLKRGR